MCEQRRAAAPAFPGLEGFERDSGARAVDRRAPPDPIRPARMACCIHTRAMEVTDEAVRLRLERIRGSEPRTEKHFPKALLWDIKRVHPHLLPPPSVVFYAYLRHPLPSRVCNSA
jgi:hypothetical protein